MTLKGVRDGTIFRVTIKLSDDVNILCDYKKGTKRANDKLTPVQLGRVMIEMAGLIIHTSLCGGGLQWMDESMNVTVN